MRSTLYTLVDFFFHDIGLSNSYADLIYFIVFVLIVLQKLVLYLCLYCLLLQLQICIPTYFYFNHHSIFFNALLIFLNDLSIFLNVNSIFLFGQLIFLIKKIDFAHEWRKINCFN